MSLPRRVERHEMQQTLRDASARAGVGSAISVIAWTLPRAGAESLTWTLGATACIQRTNRYRWVPCGHAWRSVAESSGARAPLPFGLDRVSWSTPTRRRVLGSRRARLAHIPPGTRVSHLKVFSPLWSFIAPLPRRTYRPGALARYAHAQVTRAQLAAPSAGVGGLAISRPERRAQVVPPRLLLW